MPEHSDDSFELEIGAEKEPKDSLDSDEQKPEENQAGAASAKPVDTDENGVLAFNDAVDQTDAILAAAKALSSAVKKIDKKREDEEDARQAVRTLQTEANEVLNAKLDKQATEGLRDFETVQKEMLKAHNRVDKAIDNANKEMDKSEQAYTDLLAIILPNKGYATDADD